MGIDPDTLIEDVRKRLADFIQEEMALEGQIVLGGILLFETINDDGSRTLYKHSVSANGNDPMPVWSQDGILQHGLDHTEWNEWEYPEMFEDE